MLQKKTGRDVTARFDLEYQYDQSSDIAFQMIAIVLIGTYGGMKLDEWIPNNYSVFTIICSLLSVGMAMYYVIRQVGQDSSNK